MPPDHVLAIDQGTTSTRAMLFDREARMVSIAQRELRQHYPRAGWVEHDAEDIWSDTLTVVREAMSRSDVAVHRIAAIGVTNQRETVVVWDRSTGEPVHRAIVWQDRRMANLCASLKADGAEEEVRAKTGLLLDPYFSATKLAWILDNVSGARSKAERGELAFGTIDSFLLWQLTGGAVHATDATNASRTMLYDIHAQRWDADLCRLFRIPEALLPDVRDNSGSFGATVPGLLDRQIAIGGMIGDQQAALAGQACFDPGMVKSTYGTGCFLLLNTGQTAVQSANRLLTTPAYRLGGRTTYALEGSIFVAGASIKWLRDGLGILGNAADSEDLASGIADSRGVYMVPAFVGLGAPHWDPEARGAIHGLTLDSTGAHLARAALEAVAYQTFDLLRTMEADGCATPVTLRVDGGMAANAWLCQFLADILDCRVDRPNNVETTALGAAFFAGLASGVWNDLEEVSQTWSAAERFSPAMSDERRQALVQGWRKALERTLSRLELAGSGVAPHPT